MESKRQEKIAKLLQQDLSDIFRLKSRSLGGAMITVTKVSVTPDLGLAKVFVSIFATKSKEDTLNLIEQHNKEIRYELGKRVRNQLRVIPELRFYEDDSLDYIENIESLLKD
ncbi:MAG: ribosome-binding factor A [Bacteroidetes bacterium]|nr:MAG: ribosome-binding factor A [Bacteroidota bacterium]